MGHGRIAVKQQDEIEVYPNAGGVITISQECWPEDDSLIVFHVEHAQALIDAITAAVQEIIETGENHAED